MTLLELCDTDTGIKRNMTKRVYVAPHFNYLHMRNALMPLMIQLASQGAHTDVSGIM